MKKIFKFLTILFLALVAVMCFSSVAKLVGENNYVYSFFYFVLGMMFLFILIENIFSKDYERIKIVYHANDIRKIKRIPQGDWIDLRASEDVELKAGEFKLIDLGVSMQLPKGYEAHIVPRSSTYKNFHVVQANGIGIIDNSYSGTNDVWKFPALALKDTVIHKNDRICQFRIVPTQPEVHFIETNTLDAMDRNGFGSTGKN